MANKRIGVLFGMEDTFPWALMNEINELAPEERRRDRERARCKISHLTQEQSFEDCRDPGPDQPRGPLLPDVPEVRRRARRPGRQQPDLVVGRRQVLRQRRRARRPASPCRRRSSSRTRSTRRTRPRSPSATWTWSTGTASSRYLGFPIFMKPAYGGGWKDVYKCDTPRGVLRGVRQDARPRDDGAGGDRVHRLLPLLRRRARSASGSCVRPEGAAPPPLRGGARQAPSRRRWSRG